MNSSLSFSLDSIGDVAVFLVIVVTAGLASWLSVARPWRSGPTGLADRLRIGAAIARYDFWLEFRGVDWRRRRDLREELRANLDEAAARTGAAEAVAALGPLRKMAAAAVEPVRARPQWTTGFSVAMIAFLVVFLAELFAMLAWTSAAEASGAGVVEGALPLFPGSRATWEAETGGGFSAGLEFGWTLIAAAAVGFLLGSRIWLALGHRRGAALS